MREIKFRAWDSTKGRFAIENDELAVTFNGDIIHNGGGVSSRNDLQIMQYTGVKDKNGAEIYEGDMLRISDQSSRERVVREVKWLTIGWTAFVHFDDIEVIGNIYENPELLKATK